jgi:hypothetical protein
MNARVLPLHPYSYVMKEENKMLRKIVSVFLLLSIVLSATTCSGDKLPSAEEIVAAILESQERIETYQMDMDMEATITVEVEDETIEMHVFADYDGSIDVQNTEMEMVMDINMAMANMGEMEMAESIYIVDDTMYIGLDMPAFMGGSTWMKTQLSEEILTEMCPVESLIALIETAEITVLDSEKVNGVDCYVVEVVPDADQLWEYVSQQLQFMGDELEMPDSMGELIRKMYDNVSVIYYIAKDTHFLIKSAMDMTITLTANDLGFPEEEGSMTMVIATEMLAFDYNQPVSIELPQEAEDAIEVPLGDFTW